MIRSLMLWRRTAGTQILDVGFKYCNCPATSRISPRDFGRADLESSWGFSAQVKEADIVANAVLEALKVDFEGNASLSERC